MRISVADLPSLSPLVHDYYFAFGEVREFFNGDFRDSAAYERQMGGWRPASMLAGVWLRF